MNASARARNGWTRGRFAGVLAAAGSVVTGAGLVVIAGSGAGMAAGNPGGNNGTVQIASLGDLDQVPDNEPHLPCTFTVQWHDYQVPQEESSSTLTASVGFALQQPTSGSGYTMSVSGNTAPSFTPASVTGAGNGMDHEETYTLGFTGTPQVQGYHVSITVSTPWSRGSDTKSKVVWVGPCDTPGDTETTPGDTETTPGDTETTPGDTETTPGDTETTPGDTETTPGDTETTPGDTETTPGDTETTPGDEETVPDVEGTEVTAPQDRPSETLTSPGETESVVESPDEGTQVQPTVRGTEAAGLPTAVEAGLATMPTDGSGPSGPLGPGLVGAGVLMLVSAGGLGLGRRRRGAHQF